MRRALLDCVVLSLQDTPVFYPCCKGCFSRISVEQRDRCRCSRCGYSCAPDLLEHRYRLSLKVARDGCIFGLTVFGSCLNPFFGIDASGLQRLVVNLEEPVGTSVRSTLLLKAVQDCFIGRHFIFGIKVNETEPHPWIKGAAQNGSAMTDKVHVIASQMILPPAADVEGCTVLSYYQTLLHKAAEFQLGSADSNKVPRLPPASLLVNPRYSPQSSFDKDVLWSSGRCSALSSQQTDSTFTPTPPWQQSLGLVTSSAEQEEDQGSGDEDERFNSSHPKKGNCPKEHEDCEETTGSPLSLARGSYDHRTLEVSPCSLSHGSKAKWPSSKDLTETLTSGSAAWEDLPFSESLTEFLCQEHSCDITEPERNAQDKRESSGTIPQLRICPFQASPAATRERSRPLTDVTNTPSVKEADGRGTKRTSEDAEEEEERYEAEDYNCSADLFSDSVPVVMVTDTPVRSIRETHQRRFSGEMNVSQVTPNKHGLRRNGNLSRGSLRPAETPRLRFIPPSQSTPILTAGSPASCRCSTSVGLRSQPGSQESPDFEVHTPAKPSSSLCDYDPLVRALCPSEALKTASVSGSRSALKRRFWKPGVTNRHLKVQRAAPNAAAERVHSRCDTSSGDVITCEEMNDILIPPTPLNKRQSRNLSPADISGPNLHQVWEEEQEDGANEDGLQGASAPYLLHESKDCDWSRDLFSDSV